MVVVMKFCVTLSEFSDIQEQLAVYRKANDRNRVTGEERTDREREIAAVATVLGDTASLNYARADTWRIVTRTPKFGRLSR